MLPSFFNIGTIGYAQSDYITASMIPSASNLSNSASNSTISCTLELLTTNTFYTTVSSKLEWFSRESSTNIQKGFG